MRHKKHAQPEMSGINYSYGFLGMPNRRAMAVRKRQAQKWLKIPGAL